LLIHFYRCLIKYQNLRFNFGFCLSLLGNCPWHEQWRAYKNWNYWNNRKYGYCIINFHHLNL